MSKTVTVASKFTEEELDKIDWYVKQNHTTRSALFHELVMNGVNGTNEQVIDNSNIREVVLHFIEDFAYFWKGRDYRGIVNGDEVSVYFGGEWKNYKLDEIPVEVREC